jgi:hypothetical protein
MVGGLWLACPTSGSMAKPLSFTACALEPSPRPWVLFSSSPPEDPPQEFRTADRSRQLPVTRDPNVAFTQNGFAARPARGSPFAARLKFSRRSLNPEACWVVMMPSVSIGVTVPSCWCRFS